MNYFSFMELVVFFLLSFPLQLWTVAGQRQTTSRGEKCINFNLSLFQTLFEHQFQFAGETFEERIKYQFGRNVSETGSQEARFSCQLKIIGWKGKIGFVINHFASREWRVNHKSRSPSYFNFHSVPILNLHQIHYPRWGGRTMELNFQWNLVNGKVHELEPTWLEGWRRKEEAQICLALTTNRWNTNRKEM